jgi:hypothetical protein
VIRRIRIWWRKRRARALVVRYMAERDRQDCGAALGRYVAPRLGELRRKANAALDACAALDPGAPTDRL